MTPSGPERSSAEVIIVGGGPAGATTAWMAARAGLDVVVLERARFPRDKACAEYVSPEASRILADMSLLERLEQAGAAQLAGMRVRAPGGDSFRGDFAGVHGFRSFRNRGLAMRRPTFDAMLLREAEAAGARIIEEATVTDVLRDGEGRAVGVAVRTAPTAGGRRQPAATFDARVVVGADGLHSVVARRLGLVHTAIWPRRVAFVTHFRGVGGMSDVGEMHVERDGYIGLADVGHGETNISLVVPSSQARGAGSDRANFLWSWINRRPHLANRLRDAERTSPVRATGPFAQHAGRAWAPGAALVGDAADFFDPFTGEGIYAAMRGAELLAPYLHSAARAVSPSEADAALSAYDRCRRDAFRGKWIVERIVATAVAIPFLMNRATRSLAQQQDMADLLVGVTGDFVPPSEILRASYLLRLLMPLPRATIS